MPSQLHTNKLQPYTCNTIYVRPTCDTSHHQIWIPSSSTLSKSQDVTFLKDTNLEQVIDLKPAAESFLAIPATSPVRVPIIQHQCIYNSNSDNSNHDDDNANEDPFLTPNVDFHNMPSFNLSNYDDDSDNIFITPHSQVS